MSSSVAVGALVGWTLVLTVKHIIADFVLQNSWMAIGKDQKTGWALPLLAHCLVHLAVAMALILMIAPRFRPSSPEAAPARLQCFRACA